MQIAIEERLEISLKKYTDLSFSPRPAKKPASEKLFNCSRFENSGLNQCCGKSNKSQKDKEIMIVGIAALKVGKPV
jgi:hypothetical protein